MPIVQTGPNSWRLVKEPKPDRRGKFPTPQVMSDTLPYEIEQVDGKFYSSKAEFRRVGRAYGMVEIGDQAIIPKTKEKVAPAKKDRRKRREALQKALYRVKNGK